LDRSVAAVEAPNSDARRPHFGATTGIELDST
jgi:hypothetical protein